MVWINFCTDEKSECRFKKKDIDKFYTVDLPICDFSDSCSNQKTKKELLMMSGFKQSCSNNYNKNDCEISKTFGCNHCGDYRVGRI